MLTSIRLKDVYMNPNSGSSIPLESKLPHIEYLDLGKSEINFIVNNIGECSIEYVDILRIFNSSTSNSTQLLLKRNPYNIEKVIKKIEFTENAEIYIRFNFVNSSDSETFENVIHDRIEEFGYDTRASIASTNKNAVRKTETTSKSTLNGKDLKNNNGLS